MRSIAYEIAKPEEIPVYEIVAPEEKSSFKVNRPPNRLSYDDIVKERESFCKDLEEYQAEYDEIEKKLTNARNLPVFDAQLIESLHMEKSLVKVEINRLNKKLENCNLDIYKRAFDILENQDPIAFIIKVYNNLHLGDTAIGKVLLLAIANTVILNSEGLQPKLSGESGKGKTHAANAMYHLIPNEAYKREGSLSAKSLFYDPDMVDGMIFFSDDIKMNDDLDSTFKTSMTNFQKNTTHNTLDKDHKYKKTQLPKRICWWLTAVNTDYSDELINRLFDLSIDDSAAMDKEVARKIFDNAEDGVEELPESEEVHICRAIIGIIKRQLFKVKIPFGRSIEWNVPGDRRNPSRFKALVYGFAVFRHLQRDQDKDGFTMASKQDFLDTKALYEEGKACQVSKLTKAELKLVTWMRDQHRALTINEIVDGYRKGNGERYSYQAIKKLVLGEPYKSKKGLIDKVSMRVSENQRDTRYHIEEFREFKGEAVTLKEAC